MISFKDILAADLALHLICVRLNIIKVLYNGSIRKICNQFDSNSIRKFWKSIRKIRKIFGLPIRNSIRFEGKIIRFVRFEKFLIRLIRKSIFHSKNREKLIRNSFDSIRLYPYVSFQGFFTWKLLITDITFGIFFLSSMLHFKKMSMPIK